MTILDVVALMEGGKDMAAEVPVPVVWQWKRRRLQGCWKHTTDDKIIDRDKKAIAAKKWTVF